MTGQWLSAHRICLQQTGTLGYFNTSCLTPHLHNLASCIIRLIGISQASSGVEVGLLVWLQVGRPSVWKMGWWGLISDLLPGPLACLLCMTQDIFITDKDNHRLFTNHEWNDNALHMSWNLFVGTWVNKDSFNANLITVHGISIGSLQEFLCSMQNKTGNRKCT